MEELRERGFGHELGFGKTPAVIVIDMMSAFTNPSMPLGMDQSNEIKVINRLLNFVHEKKLPVYFTITCYNDEDLADAGLWYRKQKGLDTLRAGTKAVEIDPNIDKEVYDAMIPKKYASAFFGTDLVSRLNCKRVDTLIITGCTTSGCVRATAVDAIPYGYIPIVVEGAVADRLKQAHEQSLIDMQLKYADVLTLDKVINYLRGI